MLVSSFGGTAALLASGGVVLAYCAVMWRSAREGNQAPPPAAFDPASEELLAPAGLEFVAAAGAQVTVG